MIHNVSPCAFMGRAEVLVLFIFMNVDFLDSPPVGISHTYPQNSPAIPAGKCNKWSFITRKMGESRMELGQRNVFLSSDMFAFMCACHPAY